METASLEYRLYPTLTAQELEFLIVRGWRRFGVQVFRPGCRNCHQCVPIRVRVTDFQPSKDQRRATKRNSDVEVTLHRPTASDEHLDLYNAWHAEMTQLRQWPEQQATANSYAEGFLSGAFESGWEMQYRERGELIGVGLIDLLPTGISSAYFFHAPHWRPRSPGTYSVLCEIDFARQLGLEHLYLGFWISQCGSMNYKNRFRPHEVLLHRPADSEIPHWQTPDFSS